MEHIQVLDPKPLGGSKSPYALKIGKWNRNSRFLLWTGLALVLGYVFVTQILPKVLELVAAGISVGILCAIFGAVAFALTRPIIRTRIRYAIEAAASAIVKFLTPGGYHAVIKGYIRDLVAYEQVAGDKLALLDGSISKMQQQVNKNERERHNALELVRAAQETNDQDVLISESNRAAALEESNENLQGSLNVNTGLKQAVKKLYKAAKNQRTIIETRVKVKEDELAASTAGASAAKSVLKMFGASPERLAFEEAMEEMTNDTYTAVGQIHEAMEQSSEIISKMDLMDKVNVNRALEQIQELDRVSDRLLGSGDVVPPSNGGNRFSAVIRSSK